MKKAIIIALFLIASLNLFAQTKLTKENIQKDSTIKADIIDAAISEAQGEAPDWTSLSNAITKKYDAVYADRNVTKNQIYFYYGKDWSAFDAALIKYTEKYEPKDNINLLNKNAGMILKYSSDKSELEIALRWSKLTVDKEPDNANFKKTYDALSAKISAN